MVYYDNTMVFFKVHYYNLLLFMAYYVLYDNHFFMLFMQFSSFPDTGYVRNASF